LVKKKGIPYTENKTIRLKKERSIYYGKVESKNHVGMEKDDG